MTFDADASQGAGQGGDDTDVILVRSSYDACGACNRSPDPWKRVPVDLGDSPNAGPTPTDVTS
jgi:hypothetical protein